MLDYILVAINNSGKPGLLKNTDTKFDLFLQYPNDKNVTDKINYLYVIINTEHSDFLRANKNILKYKISICTYE